MAPKHGMLMFLILLAGSFTTAVKLRQSQIISYLREASDPDIIPIADTNGVPVAVDISLSLKNIIDVDRNRNELEITAWLQMSWLNPALAWNVSQDGFNEGSVSLRTDFLWMPDITIYNAVTSQEVLSPNLAVVISDGYVFYAPAVRVRVTCDLQNIDSDSGANCTLKLGSWTHSGLTIVLSDPAADDILLEYIPNPNYDILATRAKKNSIEYTCCPGQTYQDIEFQFTIKTRNQAAPVSE